MPFTVLDVQISCFVLYPKHDLFSLSPRILVVYVLFMIIVPIAPNWILKLLNVSFWGILEVKRTYMLLSHF